MPHYSFDLIKCCYGGFYNFNKTYYIITSLFDSGHQLGICLNFSFGMFVGSFSSRKLTWAFFCKMCLRRSVVASDHYSHSLRVFSLPTLKRFECQFDPFFGVFVRYSAFQVHSRGL